MSKEQILKIFKNKNNRLICVIFIIGVVLMAVSSGGLLQGKGHGGKDKDADIGEMTDARYVYDTEERLEEILSHIDGAGRVSVMITYESGVEKSLAYETKTSSRSEGSERSEDRKAVMTGDEPTVVKEVYPRVRGVIVIAEGAGSASVRAAINEAVSAALGVGAHRICVFKGKG